MKRFEKDLAKLRKQIDKADLALVKALGKRMAISKKIGMLKIKHGLPIVQKSRWKELMTSRLAMAKKYSLNSQWIDQLYRLIHSGSVAVQLKVAKESRKKK